MLVARARVPASRSLAAHPAWLAHARHPPHGALFARGRKPTTAPPLALWAAQHSLLQVPAWLRTGGEASHQTTLHTPAFTGLATPHAREFVSTTHLREGMAKHQHLETHVVAHRGFHCVSDGPHRPIENTVDAMREAWGNGVRLCECDITLSSDGQLVLCHDSDFSRLADPSSPFFSLSSSPVTSLPLHDIRTIRLRNESTVATLLEVLELAHSLSSANGRHLGLVVEVKHGAGESAVALASFLTDHPHLAPHVAVVMSFDHEVVCGFSRELARRHAAAGVGGGFALQHHTPRRMVLMVAEGTKCLDYELELVLGGDCGPGDVEQRVLRLLDVDGPDTNLDGVYLQFDARLAGLIGPLSSKCCVGVWDAPDNVGMVESLVGAGATFVNSDLPPCFGH